MIDLLRQTHVSFCCFAGQPIRWFRHPCHVSTKAVEANIGSYGCGLQRTLGSCVQCPRKWRGANAEVTAAVDDELEAFQEEGSDGVGDGLV